MAKALIDKAGPCILVIGVLLICAVGCNVAAVKMSPEQKLYSSKCSSCHGLIKPEKHDRATWQAYIEKYGSKMTYQNKQKLLEYLAAAEN